MDLSTKIQLIFLGINIVSLATLNILFFRRYPNYKGNPIVSLFFFLPFLILISLYGTLEWWVWGEMGLSPLKVSRTCCIIAWIFIAITIFLFNYLRRGILDWKIVSFDQKCNYLTGIIALVVGTQVINAIFFYLSLKHIYEELYNALGWWYYLLAWIIGDFTSGSFFDNTFVMILIAIMLGVQFWLDKTIYKACYKKLCSLDRGLTNYQKSFKSGVNTPLPTINVISQDIIQNTIPEDFDPVEENSNEVSYFYTDLRDAKRLMDDGIITEEEFVQIKAEILSKNE